MNQQILDLVIDSIHEINSFRPEGERLDPSADTVLMGDGGKLDSLGLTNLVVAIEERVEEAFGRSIVLLDESMFDEGDNPFATVTSLAGLIGEKVQ